MASSSVQNLLKRSQLTRIISSFRNPQTHLAAPQLALQQQALLANPKSENHSINLNPNPILEFPRSHNLTNPRSSLFYPTFPFGFSLNPVSATGSCHLDPEDSVSDDSGTMWADSVKKKRKKKMNKHKLRKLKKGLRRKS